MTDLQARTAKAIVNIFETGRLLGNYASVVVAPKDPGHLTYGRSQTTLASGNLYTLIASYCGSPGAVFANQLRPYLGRLQARDLSLDNDVNLRSILKQAGNDPTMHQVQDRFFDTGYWAPANRFAANIRLNGQTGLRTALGVTTVYDSVVHGSFGTIRSSTNASFSQPASEQDWITRYISIRRGWLANNSIILLRDTVYRMDELKKLANAANWDLALDITMRGITITAAALGATPSDAQGQEPVRASAQDPNQSVLSLRTPYMVGTAVQLVQKALVNEGLLSQSNVDEIYGPLTAALVKRMQANHGLTADGIVGPATWALIDQLVGNE
jgi:chitosanase